METTTKQGRRWTLDGEPIDLADFLDTNRETFTVADAARFARMLPGDEERLGGGAGADFILRCEAEPALSLAGKVIVFTGEMRTDRVTARDMALRAGAKAVVPHVDKATGLVVVGAYPGSRYLVARTLSIPCVSEAEFLAAARG